MPEVVIVHQLGGALERLTKTRDWQIRKLSHLEAVLEGDLSPSMEHRVLDDLYETYRSLRDIESALAGKFNIIVVHE